MHGIVSLLDDVHYRLVEYIWAELRQDFGLKGVYITPFPHFSYQISTHYNSNQVAGILSQFAPRYRPFHVHTTGLSVFTGATPVLYIPIVRSAQLTAFHAALWGEIAPAGDGIQSYYEPEQWMPHITIGFGDLTSETLAPIIRKFSSRDFSWHIAVNNITLIYEREGRQEVCCRYILGA
jgi:2'-5' RNA ligase